MRVSIIIVAAVFICFLIGLKTDSAQAQIIVEEGRSFGIGAMFGEPAGVSIKSWNNDRSAFDVGAAWSLSGRNEAIHLHTDYLLHSWFEDPDAQRLAFYYGIGARAIFTEDPKVGARIPLGLTYVFQNIPFDIFVEAVPIIDLTPDTEFAGNGAVGLRYYF